MSAYCAGKGDVDGRVPEIVFERGHVQDSALRFVAVNAARPRDILRDGAGGVAQMIVDEQPRAFVVVAHQRVGAVCAPDAQNFARSL
jgi:hypothetical protein